MKKKELFVLMSGINNVTDLKGVKFAYAIAKNKNVLAKEIESLQKSIEGSKEFQEYDKQRVELAEKHAKKENGKPVSKNNEYVLEDSGKFNIAFDKLKKEHQKVLDSRDKQMKEFDELLN